jgi:hypothetical protein
MQVYTSMSYRWKQLAPEHQQVAKYAAFFVPPFMTAVFWNFPSAMCYYWTCSNMYTISMELVLRHPRCAFHASVTCLCSVPQHSHSPVCGSTVSLLLMGHASQS